MGIAITNTLTGKKEPFSPMETDRVGIYACGPTVYGLTHIGNARPAVFFDVVRRFFEFSGYAVTFVSNFTDVDDKIINTARANHKTSREISEFYIQEFLADCNRLKIRPPTFAPKVTEHIPDIIALIQRLIDCGSAYVAADGEVLYAVRKFAGYGKLSKKRPDDLRVGVRIDADAKKRDPLDFSLWKPQKAADEPAWESPWGTGRPGWHIECSAMAIRYLGETFDIHGGGLDLIHPHHENEIAQAEGATGKPFAKYWLHNNLVTIQSEKMSKSTGNIFLNREFMDRHSPETLKFLLLAGHYRSPIDFSDSAIQNCQAGLHRFYTCVRKVQNGSTRNIAEQKDFPELTLLEGFSSTFQQRWIEALQDDLNTPKVLGAVFEYVRAINSVFDHKKFGLTERSREAGERFLKQMQTLGGVINLFGESPNEFLGGLRDRVARERQLDPVQIQQAIQLRNEARAKRDFAVSDAIRDELLSKGIEIKDSATGTDWDVILK